MSGQFVRPIGIAPARRIRSTTGESAAGTASASAGTPQFVADPARSMFCFTVNGTPCSGPRVSSPATAASAARAAALASSARTSVTAFNAGFTASIRARWASTTSADDTSRREIICARSLALNRHRSPMSVPLCPVLARTLPRCCDTVVEELLKWGWAGSGDGSGRRAGLRPGRRPAGQAAGARAGGCHLPSWMRWWCLEHSGIRFSRLVSPPSRHSVRWWMSQSPKRTGQSGAAHVWCMARSARR